MRNITDTEAAYIAGIIDGEGSITPQGNSDEGYTLVIQIAMCNEEVVRWLVEVTGLGRVRRWKSKNSKHKPQYILRWNSTDSKEIIARVEPYLIVKKSQAFCLMELARIRKRQGRKPANDAEGQSILINAVRRFNKRGV